MPLALAFGLLAILGARGGWGCLQCDPSVPAALRQLRLAIIPGQFRLGQHGARAQSLLLGMEGSFFRNYALNAFVGQVETDHLDHVASFIKNEINKLKAKSLRDEPLLEELVTLRQRVVKRLKRALSSYELKACNRKTCHLLKGEVLDCLHCQRISPKCIKKKDCFVDRQPRVALQYDKESTSPWSQALPGIVVSLFLAVFVFGVILASAIIYRQNRKLLLQ
ncbi:izumo sperm-egg fusion protein 2 [Pteronotus mesoamericanus]|uniref:izumo sperm-egg fusion protein 2 n=1 Tax=Pteronotus mesoamericanus TaxID=1884717 RepID=UPI0023ECAEA0|nr:izumo sperm-egg fusion protein 2 [Pteronotus parnellii mesoamericanus]